MMVLTPRVSSGDEGNGLQTTHPGGANLLLVWLGIGNTSHFPFTVIFPGQMIDMTPHSLASWGS